MSHTAPPNPPQQNPQLQLQMRQHFRDESEFALAPMRSLAETNYQASLAYAKLALQSGLTLNGGGLVAIPALTALLKVNTITAECSLVFSYGIFTVGLVFILTAMILAHFSARASETAWWRAYEGNRLAYVLAWGQSNPPPARADIQAEYDKQKLYFAWSTKLDIAATGIGVLGGLAFLLGAISTFYVVLRYAGSA